MNLSNSIIYSSAIYEKLRLLAGEKKPSHAFLLTGNSSTNLMKVARAFGNWLHCCETSDIPCEKCSDCLLWASGTHPAFTTIRAGGRNITIDSVRKLIENTGYLSSNGKYKIYVFDEISAITEEAANAFLKTLEEPPPGTLFLLLTTRPTAVMTTISSRCMETRIALPSAETIITSFFSNTNWPESSVYLSLLLSGTSLNLVDRIPSSSVYTANESDDLLSYPIENILSRQPGNDSENQHLTSLPDKDIFSSDPHFLISLFNQVTKWLANSAGNNSSYFTAVETALKLEINNRKIEAVVEKWFKDEEKAFREIFGNKSKDPNLLISVRKREKRKLTGEYILLFLKCIETAVNLGLKLKYANTDDSKCLPEYILDITKDFPQLKYFTEISLFQTERFRKITRECRKRMNANVTEKAMLIDMCLKLTLENNSRPHTMNGIIEPGVI